MYGSNRSGKRAVDVQVIVNCSTWCAKWRRRRDSAAARIGGRTRRAPAASLSATPNEQRPNVPARRLLVHSSATTTTTTTTILLGARATDCCRAAWTSRPPRYHVDAASGPYRGLDRRRSVFRSSAWVAAVVRENGRQSAAAGRGAAAPPTNHSAPSVHRPSPAAFEVLIFARNDVIEKIALDGGIRRNRNEPRRCYCWAECFRSRCVLQAREQRRVIRRN